MTAKRKNPTDTSTPKQPPDEMWLQWHGDANPDDAPHSPEGVTWCNEKVFDGDIGPYVRSDKIGQLERELTAAKEEVAVARACMFKDGAELALLRKRVEAADGLLQQMLDVAENCDETGYADGEGFVDIDKLHGTVRTHLQAYRATEGKK